MTGTGLVDVLTTETSANIADEFPLVMWVSRDNGGSFGPATEVAATDEMDSISRSTGAVAVAGSNLVVLDDEGGREQVSRPTAPLSPVCRSRWRAPS